MQFYIIHPDPETNVKLLPAYALKKVNVREGWQILSDIGHIHGVKWEEQNKLYSASHVLTRSFCQNQSELKRFLAHYDACVTAVGGSFKKKHDLFNIPLILDALFSVVPVERTREEFTIDYLLESKSQHLTEQEYYTLREIRYGGCNVVS